MFTCMFMVCFLQTPSLVPERFDYRAVDTRTGEMLTIEWLTPEVTKNIMGAECWLYDGTQQSPC
jgi:hypothetical protein